MPHLHGVIMTKLHERLSAWTAVSFFMTWHVLVNFWINSGSEFYRILYFSLISCPNPGLAFGIPQPHTYQQWIPAYRCNDHDKNKLHHHLNLVVSPALGGFLSAADPQQGDHAHRVQDEGHGQRCQPNH